MKCKKLQKQILPVILVLLAVLSLGCWPAVYFRQTRKAQEYRELVEQAKTLSSKGIYDDAIACLLAADERKPGEYENLLLLAECYRKTGNEALLTVCNRAIQSRPAEETPYVMKTEWYTQKQNYGAAYGTLEEARANGCSSAVLAQLEEKLDNLFLKRYIPADGIAEWHTFGSQAYAVFSSAGSYGILRADGNVSMAAEYPYLGMYDSGTGTLPARNDGILCFVSTEGKRRLVPDIAADGLRSFSDGFAPFEKDGEWGYLDTGMKVRMAGLAEAGAFADGVAAVKKNGKWALIDSSLNSLTPFAFADIRLDSYGYCAHFGRCIVGSGGLWYLADTKGTVLSQGYEDIRFPASPSEEIAFCADGRWGYMRRDGTVTVLPQYADAKSFCCGLAPVKTEETWVYIRPDGTVVGNGTYTEAGEFTADGTAVVRNGNSLYMIVMSRYFES